MTTVSNFATVRLSHSNGLANYEHSKLMKANACSLALLHEPILLPLVTINSKFADQTFLN